MIGFSFSISELNDEPIEGLREEAASLNYPESVEHLRAKLQGDSLGYIDQLQPMALSSALLNSESTVVLHRSGYPDLYVAQGSELRRVLEDHHPGALEAVVDSKRYLVESWDLS